MEKFTFTSKFDLEVYCNEREYIELTKLTKFIEADPHNYEWYFKVAKIIFTLFNSKVWTKDYEDYIFNDNFTIYEVALGYIEEAIDFEPSIAELWKFKGDIFMEGESYMEAIISYTKALEKMGFSNELDVCNFLKLNKINDNYNYSMGQAIDRDKLELPCPDNRDPNDYCQDELFKIDVMEILLLLEYAGVKMDIKYIKDKSELLRYKSLYKFKEFKKSLLPNYFQRLEFYGGSETLAAKLYWVYIDLLEDLCNFYNDNLELLEHLIYVHYVCEPTPSYLPFFDRSHYLLDKAIDKFPKEISLYKQKIALLELQGLDEKIIIYGNKALKLNKDDQYIKSKLKYIEEVV